MIQSMDDKEFVEKEYHRMEFDKDARWRVSDINKDFELCNTYPRFLILPANFKDEDVESVAKFRYLRRIPTAVWRHTKNGCFIVRSSQPTVGWFGWFRSETDESLLNNFVMNTVASIEGYSDDETDQGTTGTTRNSSNCNKEQLSNDLNGSFDRSLGQAHSRSLDNLKTDLDLLSRSGNYSDRSDSSKSHEVDPDRQANHNNNLQEKTKLNQIEYDSDRDQRFAHEDTIQTSDSDLKKSNSETILNSSDISTLDDDLTTTNSATHVESNSTNTQRLTQGNASKMIIIDARSYTAAMANRAKGGGCECSEYYLRCEVQFMNLANIHSIRKSFQAIRSVGEAYSEQSNNWMSFLDNSKWLHHISGLLKSALVIVDAIDIECKSVMIHCSDGWDRTPQLVALAEIMLDPHYRTFEGFRTLVQREWLDFGHKFADRCGNNPANEDPNERSPVFLQWLDCVQQLMMQYPMHFEFNTSFLDKLNRHTYSNVFGTFSYNSAQERAISKIEDKTYSLWDYIDSSHRKFRNDRYIESEEILRPSYRVKDLHFWKDVYLQPVVIQPITNKSDTNGGDIDTKKFYDSLYVDSLTRTVCK